MSMSALIPVTIGPGSATAGAAVSFVPPAAEPGLGEGGLAFVTLEVRGRSYALPIASVIEFRTWLEPTPLPHSPRHLLGIINIRGEIVPVFDVGARLDGSRTDPTPQHVIALVRTPQDQVVGLLVDDVSNIQSAPAVTPLGGSDNADDQLVDGVIETAGTVLGVLNVSALCLSESDHASEPPPVPVLP